MTMRNFFLKTLISLTSSLFFASFVSAQSESFGDWEAKAHLGDFRGAAESLSQLPNKNPTDYYNLGTLYFRANDLGKARAYLEKALTLSPDFNEAKENLELALERLKTQFDTRPLNPVATWYDPWTKQIWFPIALGGVAIALILAGFFLIRRLLVAQRVDESLFFSGQGQSFLIILCFFLGLVLLQLLSNSRKEAIFLEAEVIRSGPAEDFVTLETSTAGSKILVQKLQTSRETSETWAQIEYAPNQIGWVKGTSLLLLF